MKKTTINFRRMFPLHLRFQSRLHRMHLWLTAERKWNIDIELLDPASNIH